MNDHRKPHTPKTTGLQIYDTLYFLLSILLQLKFVYSWLIFRHEWFLKVPNDLYIRQKRIR